MSTVFDNGEYARETHESQENVEEMLGEYYGVKNNVRLTPSGLCAISATIHGFLKKHQDGVICCIDEVYDETNALLETVAYKFFDSLTSMREWKAITPQVPVLLFVESCSNPHGRIPDFKAIVEVEAKHDDFYIVVDNTWLSAAAFNPFDHGADIVVNSLTKYYSAGHVIAGAVMTRTSGLFINISDWITLNGLHVSPLVTNLILEKLPSLAQRVEKSGARTREFIAALVERKVKVYHPLVQQPEFAKKYLSDVPSVLLVDLQGPVGDTLNKLTSYGGKDDRFEQYEACTRIALGYETANTCADLLYAFALK